MPSSPIYAPYSGLNYRSVKRFMARQFSEAGLPFADEDALDLVLGLSGLSHADYVARGTEFVTAEAFEAMRAAADRRLAGVPVDRILGWRDFYGRQFGIENVLSPRGDSEVLLLGALEALRDVDAPRVLDLGTGSGALAVTLLAERTDARGVATDVSEAALQTAAANARTHGVSERLDLAHSDWFDALPPRRFDAVLSNPPYITEEAMADLPPEVARFDPELALAGGVDGLDPYRIVVPSAAAYLVPDGWLGVEIGFDQGDAVGALFADAGFSDIAVTRDPAGLPRVVSGRVSAASLSASAG